MTTTGTRPRHGRRWHAIMMRDDYRCAYCGCKLDDYNGTLDHVVPVSQGGSSSPRNLVAACKPCNNKKRDNPATAMGRPDLVGERIPANDAFPEPETAGPPPLGVNCNLRRYRDRATAVEGVRKRVLANVCIYGDELASKALKRPEQLVYFCQRCQGFHMIQPVRKPMPAARKVGSAS